MIDEATINNWFTYHAPDADQRVKYEAIRAHAREFAHVINNLVPDSADKTTALRTLREAVMWANAAIATAPQDAAVSAQVGLIASQKLAEVTKATPYQTTTGFSGGPGTETISRTKPQETLEDVVAGFARTQGANL